MLSLVKYGLCDSCVGSCSPLSWTYCAHGVAFRTNREFNPSPVPYFRADWSCDNFYGILPSARVVVSYNRKYVREVLVACTGRNVVRWTDRRDMTIAVEWDVKQQTKPKTKTPYMHRYGFRSVQDLAGTQCSTNSGLVLCFALYLSSFRFAFFSFIRLFAWRLFHISSFRQASFLYFVFFAWRLFISSFPLASFRYVVFFAWRFFVWR